MRCRKYETQREVLKRSLSQVVVKEFTLKGVLNMSERAQVRVLLPFLKSTGLYNGI